MKYVSLHHHSTYSYMDGYGLPKHHVKRVADLGMSALALTEHGNVSSHVKLEQAAQEHGIKPIFGLEGYVGPKDMRETGNTRKWHQTILAADANGYQNLMRMVSRSWDEGFYQWPTISSEMLRTHGEGLIVLSGCLDSKLACDLLGGKGRTIGNEDDAVETLKWYKRTFGDRFYLEVQQFPELKRAHQINEKYAEWSKKFGVPLVATSDCHYPEPEQNEMQKILHAAGRNIGTVAAAEAGWEYNILLTPPTSDAAIVKRLRATGLTGAQAEGAVAATAEIAGRATVTLPKMKMLRYPLYDEPDPTGLTTEGLMRRWLNAGWKYRGFDRLPRKLRRQYMDRVKHELDVFIVKDFLDYFLVLSDAVRYAKDHGLPVGPARGSSAASLVCYLLRITEVNPMHFPLMFFERFVDPNRMDLPDVDLDFDDERRDEIRQYMISKYGEDRVGNIGTFTRYRGKNAIDDVARVYSVPKFAVDRVKEFLVERSGGDSRFDASIGDTLEMFPQVKEVFDQYPKLYRSIDLEGNYKGFGVHAAGLVVGAEPLWKTVASYTRHNVGANKTTLSVMSVDKYDGEYVGLLKLDALGLSTMGMIRHALEIVGMSLEELYAIPLDDPETLAAFKRADVIGIFQFEGRTTRMVCQEVAPDKFMDLADINALSRPGPLHSGQTGDYIAIKHGRAEAESLHPLIDRLTLETHGQIIYQEQILAICREIGKFPWVHAATIRKVIAQKKGEAAFNKLWEDFEKGATSQGIPAKQADLIWRKMVTAGAYSFNVAHCISYAMLGFWCMWLKVHHPIAFYTAQLRKVDDDEKKGKHIALMRDMQDERFNRDFIVHPPDLNNSTETWMPAKHGVYAGFEQIKGIGEKTAQAILKGRADAGGFGSWDELITIKGIGPKTVSMVREFSEMRDPFGINKIKDNAKAIRSAIKRGDLPGVPMPDTLSDQIPYEAKRSEHVVMGVVKARNPQDLYENHRSRTGQELDPATVKDPDLKDSMTLYMEDEAGLMTIKINRWAYPKWKEALWDIELNHDFVVIRCYKKPLYGKTVTMTKLWAIEPD